MNIINFLLVIQEKPKGRYNGVFSVIMQRDCDVRVHWMSR